MSADSRIAVKIPIRGKITNDKAKVHKKATEAPADANAEQSRKDGSTMGSSTA